MRGGALGAGTGAGAAGYSERWLPVCSAPCLRACSSPCLRACSSPSVWLGALVVRVLLGALVACVFIARMALAARVVLGARVVLVARGALVQKRRQRFCNKNAYEYQHKACYQARRQNVNAQQHANEGCKNRL